jgi:hypothetical protein
LEDVRGNIGGFISGISFIILAYTVISIATGNKGENKKLI